MPELNDQININDKNLFVISNQIKEKELQISLVKEWITDLRNPSFLQGRGVLKQRRNFEKGIYAYCCLGVLCEIAVKHDLLESFETKYIYNKGEENTEILSNDLGQLRNKIGLIKSEENKLIYMNDGNYEVRQHTFLEISDHIEKNILPRLEDRLLKLKAEESTLSMPLPSTPEA